MAKPEALPSLLDLTDELLVACTLLAMMEAPGMDKAMLMQMCSTSVQRCQEITAKLVRIDRHNG